jgi:hypothetical protein
MKKLEAANRERDDALGRLDKGGTLAECIREVWPTEGADRNYQPHTQRLARCTLKKLANCCGLTLNSRRDELFACMASPKHAWNLIQNLSDSINVAKDLRTFYRHYRRYTWAKQLYELSKPDEAPVRELLLSGQRAKTAEAVADFLKVEHFSTRREPGKYLLRAIQRKLMDYEPRTGPERRWLVHQLFGFFMPSARDSVKRFKWTTLSPPTTEQQYKDGNDNLVFMKDESLCALYFGNLKKTTSFQFPHIWHKKRFCLDANGLHCCDGRQELSHIDYNAFWKKMSAVINAEYVATRHSKRLLAFVLKKPTMVRISIEQLGTPVLSQMQRIVFRNGYPREMSGTFYEKVMQHGEAEDKRSYVKTRLMDGPWTS